MFFVAEDVSRVNGVVLVGHSGYRDRVHYLACPLVGSTPSVRPTRAEPQRGSTSNTGKSAAIASNAGSGASLSTGTCGQAPGARLR